MSLVNRAIDTTPGTKTSQFAKKVKKAGFKLDYSKGSHRHYLYDKGYDNIDYSNIDFHFPYHANKGIKPYFTDNLKDAVAEIKKLEEDAGVVSSLNEDLLRSYDMIKKEPTRLDRLNKIYDISEKSDLSRIFGDRTKYMRNIKYEGDYKGYDMFSFVDIHDMNDLQTCCPELNTWNSDQGEFNGDIKAQLEDLKDAIDSTINFAKRHNGKIYSFVLDKLVTV